MRAGCFIAALVWTLLLGCSDNPHGPRVRPGDPEPEVEPGLTDDQCQELAAKFTEAVQGQDAAALATLIDWDALLQNASADINVPAKEIQRFAAEMGGDGKRLGALGQQILDLGKRGWIYKYLHVHLVEHRQRLLFRVTLPEGPELNYHDLILSRRPDRQVKVIDVYIFANGELLSQTARRAFLTQALRRAQASAARLQGAERAYQLHFKKVELMNDMVREGKHQSVLELYDQLPPELQRDKNVLLTRLKAAQSVGGEAYSEAIENFRAFHPDDPCVELFAISYYVQKRDFSRALVVIDRLEKVVADDPYMNFLRAHVNVEAHDLVAARKAADTALAKEPTLDEAYMMLLFVSVLEKKHEETLARLREFERRTKRMFPDLASLPEYADFVKSPEYQEWVKARRSP